MKELDKCKDYNDNFLANYLCLDQLSIENLMDIHRDIFSFEYKGRNKEKLCYKIATYYANNNPKTKEVLS
jgi:hypothetical protein